MKFNIKILCLISLNIVLACICILFLVKPNLAYNIKSKVAPSETSVFSAHYYDRETSFEKSENNYNCIVFLGDSITEGFEWKEKYPNLNVVNRGINGDTTKGVLNRIDEVAKMKPEKVFLLIGINDIGDGINVEEFETNYIEIIKNIKENSPNTKLILQSILPCNTNKMIIDERNSRRNSKNIVLFNNVLQNVAEENKCTFIDLYNKFADNSKELKEDYTNDGIHLNGQGYEVWTKIINDYITK